MAATRIFLTTTGAGSWTVPSDWNSADNSIEVIGGGGSSVNTGSTPGGGGGAYSKISNLSLTPGASIPYSVGAGGGYDSTPGGDTWFGNSVYASANVAAKGGSTGGSGGQSSSGIGTPKYSGGNGAYYNASNNSGGGAGGMHGDGNNASGYTGGSGDAGYGGAGGLDGAGGNGTEWDSTHGSGGGSGGNSWPAGRYGAGGCYYANGYQGLIVITYTPALTTNASLLLALT